MSETPVANGRREAAMSFILVTVLIDMVTIGLIVPVLPHIVGSFTGSNEEQTWWFGAVVFAFQRPNPWPRVFGFHEIFHAFVVLAATAHFVALAGWVVLPK